jgi:hypothetical protein
MSLEAIMTLPQHPSARRSAHRASTACSPRFRAHTMVIATGTMDSASVRTAGAARTVLLHVRYLRYPSFSYVHLPMVDDAQNATRLQMARNAGSGRTERRVNARMDGAASTAMVRPQAPITTFSLCLTHRIRSVQD